MWEQDIDQGLTLQEVVGETGSDREKWYVCRPDKYSDNTPQALEQTPTSVALSEATNALHILTTLNHWVQAPLGRA